ncbi:polyunsaturated fatty acid lipoxygenase ALOX15B-like [Halichoeres trimaculatus]|uniref:polyunsaturated fatty acid lipoxygenase ALOX15B-like n=1 Tax=Halichoeres trimaculatus TaxID=147232 RepID=UPI003D9E0F20
MVNYEVTVYTGNLLHSTTLNNVYIKLVGTDGESHHTWLIDINGPFNFTTGAVATFTVSCSESIGKLLMIRLNKETPLLFLADAWFPAKVEVKSPEGDIYHFPVYRWITDSDTHIFREGKALLVYEDTHALGKYSREKELNQRKEDYEWEEYERDIPHCIKAESASSLPYEVQFSFTKELEFLLSAAHGLLELKLEGLANCQEKWTDMDSIYRVFCCKKTDKSAYVHEHWKDDEFFSYQFLNGVNPMLIRRCSVLPENFPVTDGMVFLRGERSLEEELQSGNIYLCDYRLLDRVETNTINGKKQYLMAPLVLLQKTPDDKLMPIAIQLKQTPAEDNPIFLPSDSEYDWLLAKTFVRSADFNYHELNVHLLRTHLLAEVFAVSLLRNVPMVHPLYKLLVPHTRYTLQINVLARRLLISATGTFMEFTASGGDGVLTILKKSLSELTYSSLCIPEDIAERGLEALPNFYYRDDGLKLWDIIHRFVKGIITYYYKNDGDVQKDCEVQNWISDIFVEGFLSNADTGIPQKFTTVAELVKFVTMVIFTCSVQHAAVNSGQFDFGAWMPNWPTSMQLPPPTTKGKSSENTLLQTLPDVNVTVNGMAIMHLLSKQSTDLVPLGKYPDQLFFEKTPLSLIKKFQGDLEVLDVSIKVRNESLDLPYTYIKPTVVENSVAV